MAINTIHTQTQIKSCSDDTMTFSIVVDGSAYGSQAATSAYQFVEAALDMNQKIHSVFFYRDGVLNGNQLNTPANDEFDLVLAWQMLSEKYQFPLHVCVAAALRRGIVDEPEAKQHAYTSSNLAGGFSLVGLGDLTQAMLTADRVIQF